MGIMVLVLCTALFIIADIGVAPSLGRTDGAP